MVSGNTSLSTTHVLSQQDCSLEFGPGLKLLLVITWQISDSLWEVLQLLSMILTWINDSAVTSSQNWQPNNPPSGEICCLKQTLHWRVAPWCEHQGTFRIVRRHCRVYTGCVYPVQKECPTCCNLHLVPPFRDYKKKSLFHAILLSFIQDFSKEFMFFAKGKFKLTVDDEHYFSR